MFAYYTSWKNWLQIPYFDIEGNLTGVQWRNLGIEGPRFRFPYGSNCHIYNLPVLKMLKPGEELWIAEGCSDCWALLSSGHKAIAIPSATLLKPKDLEVLSTLNSQLSTLNTQPPHVPRCRPPRRTPLPQTEGTAASTHPSSVTRWLQRLL